MIPLQSLAIAGAFISRRKRSLPHGFASTTTGIVSTTQSHLPVLCFAPVCFLSVQQTRFPTPHTIPFSSWAEIPPSNLLLLLPPLSFISNSLNASGAPSPLLALTYKTAAYFAPSPCSIERKTLIQSVPSARNGANSPPTRLEATRSSGTQRAERRLKPARPNHRHNVLLPADSVCSRRIHSSRSGRARGAHWRGRRVLLDAPFQLFLLVQSANLPRIPAQFVHSSKGSFTSSSGVTNEKRNAAGRESVDAARDGFEIGLQFVHLMNRR